MCVCTGKGVGGRLDLRAKSCLVFLHTIHSLGPSKDVETPPPTPCTMYIHYKLQNDVRLNLETLRIMIIINWPIVLHPSLCYNPQRNFTVLWTILFLINKFFYRTTNNNFSCFFSFKVCGKVFNNASALTKHKLTHSDERKYVCTMCGKAFKRQDHL